MKDSQSSFFFFQAEDGIRAATVTGVQTCALPISEHRHRHRERRPDRACLAERRGDDVARPVPDRGGIPPGPRRPRLQCDERPRGLAARRPLSLVLRRPRGLSQARDRPALRIPRRLWPPRVYLLRAASAAAPPRSAGGDLVGPMRNLVIFGTRQIAEVCSYYFE